MKLIDKDKIAAEIEKRKSELQSRIAELGTSESNAFGLFQEVDLYDDILSFLDTLEVKEGNNLEKEIDEVIHNYKLNNHRHTSICSADIEWIAEHFFELGLKANQENNVIGILEREVKIDAGGYPYINCDIEFYDYDTDIPLAKEGDKVKVIIKAQKGE